MLLYSILIVHFHLSNLNYSLNEGKYSISMSRRDGQSMKVLKMDTESGKEIIRF